MSSSVKEAGWEDWIVIAPMAWPRLISGSASLERVPGSSGFLSRAASSLTSSASRCCRFAMHQPTIESPPTSIVRPCATICRPASPVAARSTAHFARHRAVRVHQVQPHIVHPEPFTGQLHDLVDQLVGIQDAAGGARDLGCGLELEGAAIEDRPIRDRPVRDRTIGDRT